VLQHLTNRESALRGTNDVVQQIHGLRRDDVRSANLHQDLLKLTCTAMWRVKSEYVEVWLRTLLT
jgi:hypothetical protein